MKSKTEWGLLYRQEEGVTSILSVGKLSTEKINEAVLVRVICIHKGHLVISGDILDCHNWCVMGRCSWNSWVDATGCCWKAYHTQYQYSRYPVPQRFLSGSCTHRSQSHIIVIWKFVIVCVLLSSHIASFLKSPCQPHMPWLQEARLSLGPSHVFLCHLSACSTFFRCLARAWLLLPTASRSSCFQKGSASSDFHCARTGIHACMVCVVLQKGLQVTCISILAHLSSSRAEMHLKGTRKMPLHQALSVWGLGPAGENNMEVWFWLDQPSLKPVLSIFSKCIFSHLKVNL